MITTARLSLILVGVGIVSVLARSASADTATVRCVSRQDQIAVYDSLSTRGVEAKLKCGEEVEIIARVQDYVKIRSQNGIEGYVRATSFASAAASSGRPDASPSVASDNAASLNATTVTAIEAHSATAADVLVNHPTAAGATSSSSAKPAADSDDLPVPQPENESADPACQNYFSAYGLAPSQMKWIEQNRKKLFANVCPAPNVSKVDFVIIFTHDVDFFSATMPTPVHQVEGFSDFEAMTPMDTQLMSASEADKAHHQYVWIFRFAPGTFDPANFSPRRRYQFSTVESSALSSKAGLKTVVDAFRFVATASH
jgi:hypothetical protein